MKISLDDCIRLAHNKGIKFLASNSFRSKVLYLWQCQCGKVWAETIENIQSGKNFPCCSTSDTVKHESNITIKGNP